MKHLYIIFLISILPILAFGQNDFFTTDSLSSFGIKLIDGGSYINSQFCQVKNGDKTIRYTPYEVKKFGFKNGRVYISKEIQIADTSKSVFLERLYKGETTLYYYKGKGIKTFFIEKDSTLFVEIPKRNEAEEYYSKQLLNLTKDCPNVAEACKLVQYRKKSLSKFIKRYNRCELKPFPHFKYGFLVGYEYLRLISASEQINNLKYFDYKYDGSFSVGLFIDHPILVSNFSLRTELFLSKHSYSYNKIVYDKDLDFVADFTSLKFPFQLKYAYPSNKICPFINVGIIGTYFLKNKTLVYEATIYETTVEINEPKNISMFSDFQFGYVIGTGLEYKLNYKNSLFFELRYSNQKNQIDSEFLGNSSIGILTGINF